MPQGSDVPSRTTDAVTGLPYVKKWVRTSNAIIFLLSNKVVQVHVCDHICFNCRQVNFYDHTKVILDCVFDVLLFINEARETSAYRLQDIESTCHSFASKPRVVK
jgi:hypothetical protein